MEPAETWVGAEVGVGVATGAEVGGTEVAGGGNWVAVGGTEVAGGGNWVAVGGTEVAVDGLVVALGWGSRVLRPLFDPFGEGEELGFGSAELLANIRFVEAGAATAGLRKPRAASITAPITRTLSASGFR